MTDVRESLSPNPFPERIVPSGARAMSRINEDISSPSTPQSKLPSAPPPPYTEFAAGPLSSASVPFPSSSATPPAPNAQHAHPLQIPTQVPMGVPLPMPHAHPGYGPTPLATNQPLLPYAYYESRGSADARAKWRFFQALVWGIALWAICGFVIGVELWGVEGWNMKGWMRSGGLDGVVRYWLKLRVSNGAFEFA